MKKKELLYSLAEEYALGFLNKGREGWDVPHTRAVVYYAKLITKSENQDLLVITTDARLHDIGYFGITEEDAREYEKVKEAKEFHMEVGARVARRFVDREEVAKILNNAQQDRVVHLVWVHDRLEELKDLDEIILMEADTLGSIDVRRVKPTFDQEGRKKYLDGLHRRRKPIFKTDLGKELLQKLIPKFENYRD